MSRILRRPMFRGGRVDSRGTGITSGLMDDTGYADGGRVNLRKAGIVSRPVASSIPPFLQPTSGISIPPFLQPTSGASVGVGIPSMSYSDIIGVGDAYRKIKPLITSKPSMFSALIAAPFVPGFVTDSGYEVEGGEEEKFIKEFGPEALRETSTGEAITGYYLTKNQKRAADLLKRGEPGDKEMAEKLLKSSTPNLPKEVEPSFGPLRTSTEEDLAFATGTEVKKRLPPPPSSDETDIEDLLDEKKIKREADLYAKLLGGEEAKSQALYDALLAASPAFFKGKNLREAAPQVLESINKSGAFDKPRDIKQAAAQLAIQRRIAVETARAKSDDQLTRLEKQLAAKDTVLNKLSRIPGFSRDQFGGNLLKEPTPDQYPSIPPDKYFSIDGKIYASIGENIKDPKTGKIIKITTKFAPLG